MPVALSEKVRRGTSSLREATTPRTRQPIGEITVFPDEAQTHTPSSFPKPTYQPRPMEPLEPPDPGPEPVYGSVTAKQWELWVAKKEERNEFFLKRHRAEIFAQENDLRGTF